MPESLEQQLVALLTGARKTLAVAESCTGGLISHRITNIPGASAVYLGGFITYDNALKTSILGVAPDILKQHGAVSRACALAMVQGLFAKTAADYCVATTGIAGPAGGTAEKPVGTVFIATLMAGKLDCQKFLFPFEREKFKFQAASMALTILLN